MKNDGSDSDVRLDGWPRGILGAGVIEVKRVSRARPGTRCARRPAPAGAGLIAAGRARIFGRSVFSVRSLCLSRRSRGRPHETDLPPSEPAASAQARVPSQTEDEDRTPSAGPAPSQGAQAARRDGSEEVDRATSHLYRFPRAARIRRRSEIRDLFRRGKRRRTGHLDVFVAESPASRPRVGLVVPRHGRTIVERNRLKRRLREGVRLELLPRCWERGVALDILIRARAQAYEADFASLAGELRRLAERLCSHGS